MPVKSPPPDTDKTRKRPGAKDALEPVNWLAIEPHYKAGILSLRVLATRYGVSRAAITKHAAKQKPPWERNLQPAINERAQQLVAAHSGQSEVPKTDDQIVEDNAQAVSIVLLGQRDVIRRARVLSESLLQELEALSVRRPEVAQAVQKALRAQPGRMLGKALRELQEIVADLPERARTLKTLAETLRILVALERHSYGLDALDTDPDKLVVVRDYTGKGDEDSPGVHTKEDD